MKSRKARERSKYCFIICSVVLAAVVWADTGICSLPKERTKSYFCDAVNEKFLEFGWHSVLCNPERWKIYSHSMQGNPLFYEEFGFHDSNKERPVNLLLCGVHGDEASGIYICFQLVREILFDNPQALGDLKLVIAPIVNPDGFFANTRENANGVDPNRNLPTSDWNESAHKVWMKYRSDPRKYPGAQPGSEPETRLQEYLVNKYRPDKIISVHAPLGFLDFDGPGDQKYLNLIRVEQRAKYLGLNMEANSNKLLKLVDFRFFPGSLGNYAGNERQIPTYTIELPSSDPSMAHTYWTALRYALLKALSFEVYDKNERNPFFRDDTIVRHAAHTEQPPVAVREKNAASPRHARTMISAHNEKSRRVLMVASMLASFVAFQLVILQRKSIPSESIIIQPALPKSVESEHAPPAKCRLRHLSPTECDALVNACGPQLKPIVITALHTGMKKTELLNLTWDAVDLEGECITLNRMAKRERKIPLNNILKETLGNCPRRDSVAYVFFNKKTNKPYRNISKSFAQALKKAGMRSVHFRDLRDTFALNRIQEGLGIKDVMRMLGAAASKTASRYAEYVQCHTG